MKPFGDAFIKLIKMMIAPIIFCTVVIGIAGMEDMRKVGKTGGLALLYFEIVSAIALLVGLFIVNLAPWRRNERGSENVGHQLHRRVDRRGQDGEHHGVSDEHHSIDRGRRVRQGGDIAGSAVRAHVRIRLARIRRRGSWYSILSRRFPMCFSALSASS